MKTIKNESGRTIGVMCRTLRRVERRRKGDDGRELVEVDEHVDSFSIPLAPNAECNVPDHASAFALGGAEDGLEVNPRTGNPVPAAKRYYEDNGRAWSKVETTRDGEPREEP